MVITFWVFPILTISLQQLLMPLCFSLCLTVFTSQYSKMEVRHRGDIIFVIDRAEVLQFFSFLMGYVLRTCFPGIAVLQCIHVHHL